VDLLVRHRPGRPEDLDVVLGGDSCERVEVDRRRGTIPHRERQLRLVRSLGRKLLQAHLEWIDEVEQELGGSAS
jgi:hypothetical protein